MSSGYGSSGDINEIIELLSGSLCCMIIPMILSSVAVIWGAHMAQQKGRSAGAWTALTLFFGIIPFIVLCFLPDLSVQHRPKLGYTSSPMYGASSQSLRVPSAPVHTPAPASIIVTCPACETKTRVRAELANSKVKCPVCKGVIDVKMVRGGATGAPAQQTWTCECGVRNPMLRSSCFACGKHKSNSSQ